MLTAYQNQVNALLQNPAATSSLYPTATVTQAINTARGQIAGAGQCIRSGASLSLTAGTQTYSFSSLTNFVAGTSGVLNVRLAVTSSGAIINSQPWEWFFRYCIANPSPASGTPTIWAQLGQGVNGTLSFYPVPSAALTVSLDCACLPAALASDSDPEAIPYPWTDCVQYLAAYLCLLGAQSGARQADADRMFARYTEFSMRARAMSTPTTLPREFQQSDRVPPGAQAGG